MTPQIGPYDLHCKTEPGTAFTEWLRESTGPDWARATRHKFTRELVEDTLEDDVYLHYLEQDYLFIEALVNTLGHAVATAPTMEDKARLSDFLASITSDESDYFDRTFEALGSTAEAAINAGPDPATREFRRLMGHARSAGGFEEALAVIVAVEWVYLDWATDVAARPDEPERWYLSEWIELHANDQFRGTVEGLRGRLDELGPGLSAARQQEVLDLFARAVELEVAFFDAAFEAGDGGDA